MATETTPPCANCQRLQAEVDSLRAEREALRAAVDQLQRRLAAARKDSSKSSKPPPSDIVKPPKPPPPPGQQRRQPGGQPGQGGFPKSVMLRSSLPALKYQVATLAGNFSITPGKVLLQLVEFGHAAHSTRHP